MEKPIMQVKFNISFTQAKEAFEMAKTVIAYLEKEYGGSHTLSITFEITL